MARSGRASGDGLLSPARLAALDDLRLGSARVSPSRRTVVGPGGRADVEPRIMQVLVALAEQPGLVVTRQTLFERVWGGTYVGDDSLNRAIAAVRRLAEEVGQGSFSIETIPRTGYRLLIRGELDGASPPEAASGAVSRRAALLGGAAAVAAGGAAFLLLRARRDPRVPELIQQGRRSLRDATPESGSEAAGFFRQAIALDPENAEAWGLLALVLRDLAEVSPPARTSASVAKCETAARRALSFQANEPNALTALATVRPEFGNWGGTEDSLRDILRMAPTNVPALTYLVMILQSVGRAKESWHLNERALTLEPLAPVHQFRRALKLWIFGRIPEADLAIDRALQLWPRHPAVWNARLYLFAFTGRAAAGRRLVDDLAARPAIFPPASHAFWRSSLQALDSRAPADIATAREVNLQAAPKSPGFAVSAMMVLSMLGELDAAFAVAEGTLLRRGPLIGALWSGKGEMPVNDQYWRRTMNLFTPATAAMRGDARFKTLCDGIGLTRYWREKGVVPDAFLNVVKEPSL